MNVQFQNSLKNLAQELTSFGQTFLPYTKTLKCGKASETFHAVYDRLLSNLEAGDVAGSLTEFDNLRSALLNFRNTKKIMRAHDAVNTMRRQHFNFKRVRLDNVQPGHMVSYGMFHNAIGEVQAVATRREDHQICVSYEGGEYVDFASLEVIVITPN